MPFRKTETRIPDSLTASDLGEAVVAVDGVCTLISFATAPIVVGRENTYVLFVSDPGLLAAAESFAWTFEENGNVAKTETTEISETIYQPETIGTLVVTVRVRDGGGSERAALSLNQEVVLTSAELETLIANAQEKSGPVAANPDVLRELVNEHSRYYKNAKLQTVEGGDSFQKLVISMVFDGALRSSIAERREHANHLAAAVADKPEEFSRLASVGVGVCNLRVTVLAMTRSPTGGGSPPLLPWTEFPEAAPERALADEQLRQTLATLSEEQRIDLLNIARFPKSNITHGARILEALRDKFFPGTSFADVLSGMSGTRANWITRHLREGPIAHT